MIVGNQSFRKMENLARKTVRILMADDDPKEQLLMVMASEGTSSPIVFDFVQDGGSLLTELYVAATPAELPNLIILDLHMPRLDGARTLVELQEHPVLWQVPVVVFTSSLRIEDETMAYARGAVLFQTKPSSFSGMEEFLERAIRIATHSEEYVTEISLANVDVAASAEDGLNRSNIRPN